MIETYYTADGVPMKRPWWKIHKMPMRWKLALAGAIGAAGLFYLVAPVSADLALHQRQTLAALGASLAVAGLVAALAGMVHRGRKLLAAGLLLGLALLANAALFVAYCSAFGLFGL